ncbi:MAG: enoyl-CoA hydratase/isomerase family protein [Betaproteobacteria bacterium]|nr:enoyl-CoA hydratase/isomerase family protein [Betaproteobacteria bacterium]
MKYRELDFDVQDNVAWIRINRPDALNAINLQSLKELCDIANRCGADKSVRAAVLTGTGERAFCAGGDIAEFAAHADAIELLVREMTGYLHLAVSRFAWMRAPLIAAVNGVAAGAGLSLAAACDLAIASDGAKFTTAYTRIGFTPDGSSTYFLSRLLGNRRAMELYLTNRVLSAQEALDWGLVNRVVAAKDLAGEAAGLARQLAGGPTRAYGGVKKLLQMAANDSLESQMESEARMIAEICASADGREGVLAFAQKRKANFTAD